MARTNIRAFRHANLIAIIRFITQRWWKKFMSEREFFFFVGKRVPQLYNNDAFLKHREPCVDLVSMGHRLHNYCGQIIK